MHSATSLWTSRGFHQSDELPNLRRTTVLHEPVDAPRHIPLEESLLGPWPYPTETLHVELPSPRPAHPGTPAHSPTRSRSESCPKPRGSKCKEQPHDAPSQSHMPRLTDPAWHANVCLLLHWRVEECDSDVVDTQDASSSRRSCRHSVDQHSRHFQQCRHRVIVVSFLFGCSYLPSDQTFSCFLASVVVQPLCTDELLPDSLTLRNLVEDIYTFV